MSDVQLELASTNGHVIPTGKEARAKPTARIERVMPATAERWLASNTHNRDLREQRVYSLAAALVRREGRLTGDCICFDSNGVLINGQHRLSAIVTSEVPLDLVVLRGLPAETQEVMDQNLKRSVGDALKLRGEKYCNQLGATLGWMHRLEYIYETGRVHYGGGGLRPTTPQLLDILDGDHERIVRLVAQVATLKARSKFPLRPGTVGAIWARLDVLDAGEAEQFFTSLAMGAMLEMDSPILALRRLLESNYQSALRSVDWREAAVTMKAWNAWRDQQPVRNILWKYGPNHKDAFPKPH